MTMTPAKSFAEFFAGIGLVGLALQRSGWLCQYANDIDPKKTAIYDANFTDHRCDLRDIWETDAVVERMGHPFLATASFPCIDLSLAGHWRGLNGKHSSTFFGFAKVAEKLGAARPKLVMVENVVGFLTSHEGKDFSAVAASLASLGYWLDAFVLDARYFVPQSRPRVFLVGIHDSVASTHVIRQQASTALDDAWLHALGREAKLRPPSLRRIMQTVELETGWAATPITAPPQSAYTLDAFIDTDADQDWWTEDEVEKHYNRLSDRHRRQVDALVRSRERFVTTGYRRKRNGSTKLEVRFDGIAGCLRTPRGGSARQIVVVIDDGELRLRWMSAVEYGRLQGVDRFEMHPNERQMLFGFGDAVCVPAIEWIDRCVLSPIFESCHGTARRNGRQSNARASAKSHAGGQR